MSKISDWAKKHSKAILIVFIVIGLSTLVFQFWMMHSLFVLPKETSGLYSKTYQSIRINTANATMDRIQRVFFHELGHYVWYQILNDTERKEFTENLCEYAKGDCNAVEDFADLFSFQSICVKATPELQDLFDKMIDTYDLPIWKYCNLQVI